MGKPVARRFAVQRELDDEIIIVDARHDVAHRLDAEAARVFRACDGARSDAEIARAAGLSGARASALVAELGERGLLDVPTGDTRRGMLRKTVLTGAAVASAGAVTSVLLPTPEQAFASEHPPPPESVLGASDSTSPPTAGGDAPTSGSQAGGPRPSRRREPRTGRGPRVEAGGPTRVRQAGGRAPNLAGAHDTVAGGATGTVPAGELPFTGSNVVRTAAVGAALAATGVAGRRALRHDPPPPAP